MLLNADDDPYQRTSTERYAYSHPCARHLTTGRKEIIKQLADWGRYRNPSDLAKCRHHRQIDRTIRPDRTWNRCFTLTATTTITAKSLSAKEASVTNKFCG
jgi:hypothetical protein